MSHLETAQKPGVPLQCKYVVIVIYTRNLLRVTSLTVSLHISLVLSEKQLLAGRCVALIIIILM